MQEITNKNSEFLKMLEIITHARDYLQYWVKEKNLTAQDLAEPGFRSKYLHFSSYVLDYEELRNRLHLEFLKTIPWPIEVKAKLPKIRRRHLLAAYKLYIFDNCKS